MGCEGGKGQKGARRRRGYSVERVFDAKGREFNGVSTAGGTLIYVLQGELLKKRLSLVGSGTKAYSEWERG